MNLPSVVPVVTSINVPNLRLLEYNKIFGSDVIWVGDAKTPDLEGFEGIDFVSLDDQLSESSPVNILASLLPVNHYARKNAGYIRALRNGASYILDTDDDNFPVNDYFAFPQFAGEFKGMSGQGRINIYKHFTSDKVWPRGLGYQFEEALVQNTLSNYNIAVWQGLADLDPDVDAVFRLCYSDRIHFERKTPLVLESGLYCPFNSQNTFWDSKFLTYAYLPATVTFRFTDILRGYIAQRCFWQHGFCLGFTSANVYQERNEHDLLKDLESELVMYKCIDQLINILNEVTLTDDQCSNLYVIYEALVRCGIVEAEELNIVQAWINCINTEIR